MHVSTADAKNRLSVLLSEVAWGVEITITKRGLPLEALNGLLVAERRRRLDAARRTTLATFLRDLPIWLGTQTADQAWEPSGIVTTRSSTR